MNPGSISSNIPLIDPQSLMGGVTLNEIRKEATKSISSALKLLGTAISEGIKKAGAPILEAPKGIMAKVMDLTLRIALLQQALDELQQQVSKNVIDGRMKQADQAKKEQIENIEKQMKELEESTAKAKEAQKKAGIFGFIVAIFQAIVDFFSAVVSFIGALANLAVGNVVGAAGLFAACGAQLCSGVCNLVLAADSLTTAIRGQGFLDDKAKEVLNGIMIACAVVAGVGGLLGGVGAITLGLKEAAKAACGAILKEGCKMAAKEMAQVGKAVAKEVAKDILMNFGKELGEEAGKKIAKDMCKTVLKKTGEDVSQEAMESIVKAAAKEFHRVYKPMADYVTRMAVVQGVGQALTQIAGGVMDMKVNELKREALDAKHEADLAEAAQKALEATIGLIKKVIAELQKQLEDMLDMAMDTMSIIMNCIDDSAQTMTQLHQNQSV